MLESQLQVKMPGQEQVTSQIIAFARSFLENTQGGVIAGVGVALLFWTVINMLGNIESSFNDIWGVKNGRSFSRKFSDYLSIMLICPILMIMADRWLLPPSPRSSPAPCSAGCGGPWPPR